MKNPYLAFTFIYLSVIEMVMGASAARKKYEDAIKLLGGASAYYACGEKIDKGVKAVAECMHGLKKALTESEWASKWEKAYSG